MIYATQNCGYGRKTLHELTDSEWKTVFSQVPGWHLVDEETARKYVRDGIEHDTGLFIDDDGNVQYAEAEQEA